MATGDKITIADKNYVDNGLATKEPADDTILKEADIGDKVLAPDGDASGLQNLPKSSNEWSYYINYTTTDFTIPECNEMHIYAVGGGGKGSYYKLSEKITDRVFSGAGGGFGFFALSTITAGDVINFNIDTDTKEITVTLNDIQILHCTKGDDGLRTSDDNVTVDGGIAVFDDTSLIDTTKPHGVYNGGSGNYCTASDTDAYGVGGGSSGNIFGDGKISNSGKFTASGSGWKGYGTSGIDPDGNQTGVCGGGGAYSQPSGYNGSSGYGLRRLLFGSTFSIKELTPLAEFILTDHTTGNEIRILDFPDTYFSTYSTTLDSQNGIGGFGCINLQGRAVAGRGGFGAGGGSARSDSGMACGGSGGFGGGGGSAYSETGNAYGGRGGYGGGGGTGCTNSGDAYGGLGGSPAFIIMYK